MLFVLLALCGCTGTRENTDTRLLLDTFVTLTADCDDETLAAAAELCAGYEKLLSRTAAGSDVDRLNSAGEQFIKVSDDTRNILERAVFYGELSRGRFDITICPVSMLWDFENQIVPDRSEIAEALKSVDYHSIELGDDGVCLHGAQVDLGGIAKGYIADRLAEYFEAAGAQNGFVNLGGDIRVFGERARDIRLQNPFDSGAYAATLSLKNRCAVTSGTYERHIVRDGVNYHHILDPGTGYGVETDLASATVICGNALDGDALSTICILLGRDAAERLIEQTPDTEAVLIDNDGNLSYTSGICEKNGKLCLG